MSSFTDIFIAFWCFGMGMLFYRVCVSRSLAYQRKELDDLEAEPSPSVDPSPSTDVDYTLEDFAEALDGAGKYLDARILQIDMQADRLLRRLLDTGDKLLEKVR